ncbi:MAG: hypothetical protein R3C14_54335 [Caldilineaceae bacterium]
MRDISPVVLDGHTNEQERQLERLQAEVARLQAENRHLRRRLPESTGDMRKLRQAYRDARSMIVWRFSGYSISRSNCLAMGVSRRRWPWAIALLRLARVYTNEFTETDLEAAMLALETTYNALESAGTIARLRLRLPVSATR